MNRFQLTFHSWLILYFIISSSSVVLTASNRFYRKSTFRSRLTTSVNGPSVTATGDLATSNVYLKRTQSMEKVLKRVTPRLRAILDFIPSNVTVAGS